MATAKKDKKRTTKKTVAKPKKPAKTATAAKKPVKAATAAKKPAVARDTAIPLQGPAMSVRVVRELAAILDRRGLSEIELKTEDIEVTLRRDVAVDASMVQPMRPVEVAAAPPAVAVAAADDSAASSDTNVHEVASPFVGTFYRRPNPDSEPYVSVGQRVSQGQILCIVEAMKLMNEIESDTDGVISEILAQDGDVVEYGQTLVKITPDS